MIPRGETCLGILLMLLLRVHRIKLRPTFSIKRHWDHGNNRIAARIRRKHQSYFLPSLRCGGNPELKLNLKLYDRWSVGQYILVLSTTLGPKTRFLLLSDTCGFVDMRRPFWREDGSVIYSCCWPSPVQSFLEPSPTGLMTIFYCLGFETPQPGVPDLRVYFPQGQCGPVITPDTGFPLYHLLRLAGLRWRYS
jgi:hypothetical protein